MSGSVAEPVIYDAELLAARMPDAPSDIRAYLLAFYPDGEIPPTSERDPDAEPLVARVVHGVWLASCPCRSPGSPSPGLVVWLSVPWGWCIRCDNVAAGGRWRPIVVPEPDERAAIEAALASRTDPHRNWSPGETVADLVAENAAHGLVEGA